MRTCPFLSICKMGDCITICSNEETPRIFPYTECSILDFVVVEMAIKSNNNCPNLSSNEETSLVRLNFGKSMLPFAHKTKHDLKMSYSSCLSGYTLLKGKEKRIEVYIFIVLHQKPRLQLNLFSTIFLYK